MPNDKDRIKSLVDRINRTSSADFVRRLLDERRKVVRNADGSVSTHELAYATDDNGNAVVYPEVQSSMYGVMRYPSSIAFDRAVERGDTLRMSVPDAEMFTTGYKEYYSGFDQYASGGRIHIKPENRGKFTALKKRTGHSASWFKAHGTPAQKKMAVFELNSRKWKHNDGGMLHKYDGLTEPTGQMEQQGDDYRDRLIYWSVMHPGALWQDTKEGSDARQWLRKNAPDDFRSLYYNEDDATRKKIDRRFLPDGVESEVFNQDIRDYRDNEGLNFTLGAMSIPLTIMGSAELPGAIAGIGNGLKGAAAWYANPQNAGTLMKIGKFAMPMLGAAEVDREFREHTPWQSWGHALGDVTGIYNSPFYQYALGDIGKGFVDAGLELTHPAFFAPYEGISRGISNAMDRMMASRYHMGVVDPSMQLKMEAANEFDNALRNSGTSRQSIQEAQRLADDLTLEPTHWGQTEMPMAESSPEIARALRNMDMTARPTEQRVASTSIEAPTSRAATVGTNGGRGLAQFTDDELVRLGNDRRYPSGSRQYPEFQDDEIYSEIRKRARSRLLGNGEGNFRGVSDQQLMDEFEGIHTGNIPFQDNANFGMRFSSNQYLSKYDYENQLKKELEKRIMNMAGDYNDINQAVSHYRFANSSYDYTLKNQIRDRSRSLISQMIMKGKDVPFEFSDFAMKIAENMYDTGYIGDANPYVRMMIDKFRNEAASKSFQKNVSDYFGYIADQARDSSGAALSSLKNKYPDKSLRDILRMIEDVTPQMVGGDESVPDELKDLVKIIKRAYTAPVKKSFSLTGVRGLKAHGTKEALRAQLNAEGLDFPDLDILADPYAPGYIDAAKKARAAGISILPGDITGMAMQEIANVNSMLVKGEIDNEVKTLLGRYTPNDDIFIAFRNDFDRIGQKKYGMSLAEMKRANDMDKIGDIWKQIRSNFNLLDSGSAQKYIRERAIDLHGGKYMPNAEAAAGIRAKLLNLAGPRQTGVAEHSASANSYKLQVAGAMKRGKRGYGTGPYQTALMPLHPEYGKIDQGYVTGNDFHMNRAFWDDEGKLTTRFLGDDFNGLFSRDEAEEFVREISSIYDDGKLFDYLNSHPRAKQIANDVIRLNKALNEYDVYDVSQAFNRINRLNRPYYGEIALPEPNIYPASVDELGSYNGSSLRSLIVRTIDRLGKTEGFGGPGYATYMKRTPVIVLNHKDGGQISRPMALAEKYGSDKIKAAILKLKADRK